MAIHKTTGIHEAAAVIGSTADTMLRAMAQYHERDRDKALKLAAHNASTTITVSQRRNEQVGDWLTLTERAIAEARTHHEEATRYWTLYLASGGEPREED